MALTGLQIQKLLPKTNCKECGSNTCLAFAMKLAARKAEIADCPDASQEAIRVLGAAYEPPVRRLAFGSDGALVLGEETVLHRHDKTFVHPTLLAINIDDDEGDAAIGEKLAAVESYQIDRVGELFGIDMVAVTGRSGSPGRLAEVATKARAKTSKPLVLRSGDPDALEKAGAALKGDRCVLSAAVGASVERLARLARENGHVLALAAADLDGLVALSEQVKAAGTTDLMLQFATHSLAERFQTNSIARRAAIKDSTKPLGYPFLHFVESEDLSDATVEATVQINKYGGICVLPFFDPAQLATLITLRLNIYTDPQKPIQVEPKLYPIGEPTSESPVFLTTNFSLTYFMVSAEIENTGISAWLLVPECEGMSVLTAWAAGKLSGATVAKFCHELGLDDQVRRRQMIIPGYVAQISGELEEKMPGWTILVGPQEASDLESFVKARL